LAAFAQFASDLDEATRKQLERGRLVTELMKQPQYQPLKIWEMALTLFAVNNNYMDDVEVIKAGAFERALRDHIAQKHKGLTEAIENDRDLSSDNEAKLRSAIEEFKKTGAY
jgi:F-type H+-transporting ATPase subunit alpha